VLDNLPGGFRWLKRNERQDVIAYFETFADMLEAKLLSNELMKETARQSVEVEVY
jgi:hypothetical protein